MSKYKLTTDLIADCIALIPQNLGRLNASKINSSISFDFSKLDNNFYTDFSNDAKFKIISHCLRTIPEFQDKNPRYIKYRDNAKSLKKAYPSLSVFETNEIKAMCEPKTIWQATLYGNGTFPNTLEELCKSYKNVMSK